MECERRFMWLGWPKLPSRHYPSRSPPPSFAGNHHPPLPSPPVSPIHRHSLSFKDIETLLNEPPLQPHLRHSLSSPPQLASLKGLHTLLSDPKTKPSSSSIFHRVRAWARAQAQAQTQQQPQPPDAQNRVVVYYTSLRVIRKTFEECRAVRSILKGYRVKMDERDLSMDGAFVGELQGIIGKTSTTLPMVFVNGKYVGGAEEIGRLHESGELRRMIGRLPSAEVGVCGECGGYRFLVCQNCDGSHRVYIEKVGFMACSICNHNGLIRCSSCTSVVF